MLKGYHAHITYNDDAMVNVLELLRDAAEGAPPWNFLRQETRTRARQAVDRGVDCLLKTQVKQHGKLTAWPDQLIASDYPRGRARIHPSPRPPTPSDS